MNYILYVMKIDDLKQKPLWQMTGEEFLYPQQNAEQKEVQPTIVNSTSKKHVYGIAGIARLFGCSIPTANRIPIRKIITIGATWSLSDAELVEKIMADMMTREGWKEIFNFYQRHNPEPNANRPVESVIEMWVDKTEDGYPLGSVEDITIQFFSNFQKEYYSK
jgi:hypothetical protein